MVLGGELRLDGFRREPWLLETRVTEQSGPDRRRPVRRRVLPQAILSPAPGESVHWLQLVVLPCADASEETILVLRARLLD
ncbi:hypothetical protein CCM_06058 [Cordyceps militaris CM01]|uniref:Uncharacterized protein n=1 Tax=Cordyceps militaris (strain CM01) TaxID=983644 RepID=G3JIK1_CORMM|nr:uncharacterized protein CCM_06058 [Cordyceps militaris CM01]EGX91898.1 hypothetical protein CCM_06058 [Cordyceps militaris CM01]